MTRRAKKSFLMITLKSELSMCLFTAPVQFYFAAKCFHFTQENPALFIALMLITTIPFIAGICIRYFAMTPMRSAMKNIERKIEDTEGIRKGKLNAYRLPFIESGVVFLEVLHR